MYNDVFKLLKPLLTDDGRILIIALDGNKIMNKFKKITPKTSFGLSLDNNKNIETYDEYIIKKSGKSFDMKKPINENKIDVYVGSIGTSNTEYLVDIDMLCRL